MTTTTNQDHAGATTAPIGRAEEQTAITATRSMSSMKTPTATPRTNAEMFSISLSCQVVHADFCARLEKELFSAQQEIRELKLKIDYLTDETT